MAKPLKILALDGGGVRGKSALLILESIMENIRDATGQERTPLPCEYFDLIGGTSTGGLIAIMLGRLRMSIGQCIEAYDNLATKAFKEKPGLKLPGPPRGLFSASALREALTAVIQQHCNEDGCKGVSPATRKCEHSNALFRNHQCCKTVVLAITKDNVDSLPTLFKTYDTSDSLKDCKVWEVGRATSAATTFFKSMTCGRDNIEFIDAGFGYNNPCAVLIREAQTTFPDREFACILSIGTGLGEIVTIKDKRLEILKALKKMASSSKRVADELADTWPDNVYYRFNVTKGMEDISLSDAAKISSISAHTKNYLRDVQRQLSACSAVLQKGRREPEPATGLDMPGGEDRATQFLRDSREPRLGHIEEEATEIRKIRGKMTQSLDSGNNSSMPIIQDPMLGPMTGLATNHQVTRDRKVKTSFLVPFGRDDHFVGREDIIDRIDSILETKPRVALTGIGGIGKSQIAIEYCYRYRAKHPACPVLWVFASTTERFEQAYRDISRKLDLPGWDDPMVNGLQIVSDWLSNEDCPEWLIILDNADDENVFFNSANINANRHNTSLVSYLPPASKGSMIITSRNRIAAFKLTNAFEIIIDITAMEKRDAELLLKKRIPNDQSNVTDVHNFLEALEYLPLAITQAAAYIAMRQTRFTISKYLIFLRQSEAILQKDMGDLRRDHDIPNSILKTWQISFNQIKKHHHQAANLLSLMSVFHRQGIPHFLLYKGDDDLDFEEALATLNAFSLITSETDGQTFGMHRLVQLATKSWLISHNEISKWEGEALRLLSVSFPRSGYEDWRICEALLPHTETVSIYVIHDHTQLLRLADLSHGMAVYFELKGKHDAALKRIQRALDIRRQFLGEKDSAVIHSLSVLVSILRSQGRYDEAEKIDRQVLHEHALENGNYILMRFNIDLASVLRSQVWAEKTFGKEHARTLSSMNNLALVLHSQCKYDTAEAMTREEYHLSEKVLGKHHPSTLKSLNNLAAMLQVQGKADESEALGQQALRTAENTLLGYEHPITLTARGNMAIALKSRGKYKESKKLHQQVLETRVRVLGEEHPDTLVSRECVAIAMKDVGHYDEAERTLRLVLAKKEKLFGKEHPGTFTTIFFLARLLGIQKRYEDASIFHQRAYAGRLKVLGPSHPHTKECLHIYKDMLEEMGPSHPGTKECSQVYENMLQEMNQALQDLNSEIDPEVHSNNALETLGGLQERESLSVIPGTTSNDTTIVGKSDNYQKEQQQI